MTATKVDANAFCRHSSEGWNPASLKDADAYRQKLKALDSSFRWNDAREFDVNEERAA
jgi:hypothetical protein